MIFGSFRFSICPGVEPQAPAHGKLEYIKYNKTGDIVQPGSVVEYSCEEGWMLADRKGFINGGKQRKQCSESGIWRPDKMLECAKLQ